MGIRLAGVVNRLGRVPAGKTGPYAPMKGQTKQPVVLTKCAPSSEEFRRFTIFGKLFYNI